MYLTWAVPSVGLFLRIRGLDSRDLGQSAGMPGGSLTGVLDRRIPLQSLEAFWSVTDFVAMRCSFVGYANTRPYPGEPGGSER